MYKVSGFGELLPQEKIIEEKILDIVKSSYKQLGYTGIETPAVEKNEVLLAKTGEENAKQIFGLYGLAQGSQDTKDYSLHFDLTVPFARYVLDNQNELTFPFKRNQIQKVRRGERAQKGRFREFYQADIDVIWDDRNSTKSQNIFYDAEVIFLIIRTLKNIRSKFEIKNSITVHINNRKIVSGFLEGIDIQKLSNEVIAVIDKKDKISKDEFVKELEKIGIDTNKIGEIQKFVEFKGDNIKDFTKNFETKNKTFCKGIEELQNVILYLEKLGVKSEFKIDFAIMRGLDYYTGTVFETFVEGEKNLGSIASGGRYEKLTSFIDPKSSFSGVGGSIGISRLESYVLEKIEQTQKTSSDYLMISFSENEEKIINLYTKLLKEGKKIELYPKDDKLSKQFKYADKKGIPFCVIFGEQEEKNGEYQIKNMKTGEVQNIKLN